MQRLLFLLLSFFLLPAVSEASARVFLYPGTEFQQTAETDFISPVSYDWRVESDGNTLFSFSGETLSYTFSEPGQYRVLVKITESSGEFEETVTEVIVGDASKKLMPLKAVLLSLPPADSSGKVKIFGDSQEVYLSGAESEGDIVGYRFDENISIDSDGDGNLENDTNNTSDESVFSPLYENTTGFVTARLTVIDSKGAESSADLALEFLGEKPLENELRAQFFSLPPSDSKGNIHVFDDEAEVIFSFGESTGKIIQYRFDEDTSVDSDGDGNASNDIDNISDSSFTTGEALYVRFFRKDAPEQVVQFIAVALDENGKGKGSMLQRNIVFREKSKWGEEKQKDDMFPQLIVNKAEAKVGENIEFHVLGTPPEAKYKWDFNGDTVADISGQEVKITHAFEFPGSYSVKLTVELGEREQSLTQDILITEKEKQTSDPISLFTYERQQNLFTFTNLSRSDATLENTNLTSEWNFGDGSTSTEENPKHEYKESGEFTVVLKVTDSQGLSSEKQELITLEDIPETSKTSKAVARFEFKNEQNLFTFTNLSRSDDALENTNLTSEWNFGDGSTSTEENPKHEYKESGEFTVVLKVTDSQGASSETSEIFSFQEGAVNTLEEKNDALQEKGFSWWKLLFALLIIVFGGIGILFFFRKTESPDLGFGEIFREETERWTERMKKQKNANTKESVKDISQKTGEDVRAEVITRETPFLDVKEATERKDEKNISLVAQKPNSTVMAEIFVTPKKEEKPAAPVEGVITEKTKEESKHQENEIKAPHKEEPVPEWLRGVSVPVPEKKENIPPSPPVNPAPEKSSEEKVPDWLKSATAKSENAQSTLEERKNIPPKNLPTQNTITPLPEKEKPMSPPIQNKNLNQQKPQPAEQRNFPEKPQQKGVDPLPFPQKQVDLKTPPLVKTLPLVVVPPTPPPVKTLPPAAVPPTPPKPLPNQEKPVPIPEKNTTPVSNVSQISTPKNAVNKNEGADPKPIPSEPTQQDTPQKNIKTQEDISGKANISFEKKKRAENTSSELVFESSVPEVPSEAQKKAISQEKQQDISGQVILTEPEKTPENKQSK